MMITVLVKNRRRKRIAVMVTMVVVEAMVTVTMM
jgi:predicted nucleic acid-binding Zn ribbon protein